MKFEKLLLYVMGAALALVCLRFPVWGIIALERKLDTYPIVSRETVTTIDEMGTTLEDFGEACEVHQFLEGEYIYRSECGLYPETRGCSFMKEELERVTTEMYAAVDRRKALAARADWGLLKSMTLGAQAYTHSTWLCAQPYARFSVQIGVGFTPTYDTSS